LAEIVTAPSDITMSNSEQTAALSTKPKCTEVPRTHDMD